MPEESAILIARLNRSYPAIYRTLYPETRCRAERTFSRRQNGLRQRSLAFHQPNAYQCVLDATHSQALVSSPHSRWPEGVL
jgi:hypothetical protein